jgi:hypothetical protein
MQVLQTTLSPDLKNRRIWGIPVKVAFPIGWAILALIGIFSPLFDLNHIHGLPSLHLFSAHLFFEGLADAGGYYASTFCKHWYHRVPIAIGFALISTLALTTLVG